MNYVSGASVLDLKLDQTVVAGTMQGSLFDTWAGAVSLAMDAEYRREKVASTTDPVSLVNGYFAANYKPTNGSYDVKEAFAEVVVPLVRQSFLGYSLDLNAAYRYTDYSLSGGVPSWKIGLTYSPIRDLLLRATRSRDIRAPNLNDLFQGGTTSVLQNAIENGVTTTGITATVVGNPAVKPEKADTLTAGIVYSPSWLSGASVSFDYFDIKINDAILTPTLQAAVNQCAGGNTSLCGALTRNSAGTIVSATLRPFNLASDRLRGFDIEARYTHALSGETRATLRSLFSHVIRRELSDGITTDRYDGENAVSPAGSTAKWRGTVSVGLDGTAFSTLVTGRYTSPGKYDQSYTAATLADNHIPGAMYVDFYAAAKVPAGQGKVEIFLNIDNVFNKHPVIVSPISQPFLNAPINSLLYDTIGREFKVGVRSRF